MPSTQVDLRPVHNLDAYVGMDIAVKVLKLNRRRNNIVVSRKAVLEEELAARKAALLENLKEGDLVTGVVKNLTEYGAFIDLGGIDGLLHVSDISYGRVAHPQDVLQVGQEITVKVLKFDREKERISLGLKQVLPDPWETVGERYQPGMRVIGRVVSVTDYGAFVELEPGVEGLIHISEMTWSRRMKHPSKVVKVGDNVESVVLDVRPHERRISLGIKQLEPDPWTTVDQRYAVGSVVEGRVRKLADFGAFVEIEEGIDGLVHVSDLSWTRRIQHPSEVLKKGQVVQAVILSIDAPNRRLSLGIKQLQPDAWETFFQQHHVGDIVRGKPTRAASFGVFVELAPGVEGLCHNSEIPPEMRRQSPPLPIGEEMNFRIIKMNEAERRIGLSVVTSEAVRELERIGDYQRQAAEVKQHIEEALHGSQPRRLPASHLKRNGNTMTKADLIEEISRVCEFTRKESEVIVEAIFDSVVRALREGDKIEIRGFGSFRTRQRKARIGRNPKTGARVDVPAKRIPVLQAEQGTQGPGQPGRAAARGADGLSRRPGRGHGPALEPLAVPLRQHCLAGR